MQGQVTLVYSVHDDDDESRKRMSLIHKLRCHTFLLPYNTSSNKENNICKQCRQLMKKVSMSTYLLLDIFLDVQYIISRSFFLIIFIYDVV